jgi:O-antigen ligase
MPIVALIAALAALVWAAIYARRGSLVVGCGLFLAVGYVVGYDFWNVRLGSLPVTLDRVVLVGLVAAFVVQWRDKGVRTIFAACPSNVAPPPRKNSSDPFFCLSDWLLGGLLVVLVTSAALSGTPDVAGADTSKWGRLVTAFIIPAVLYWIARQTPITGQAWRALLAILALLGIYLAVTAVAETAGLWSLVFPRYIADPTLGIHFGRARGPTLNAASMGLYLTACLWCGWTLFGQVRRGWQLVLLAALPAMALGVVLTYTRSTWLGLAASGLVVLGARLPRRWRWPAVGTVVVMGTLLTAVDWNQLVHLQREDTASQSQHSVDQRLSFAYVSWQMFKDHPIFGVGWGRFYDRKLPYLSDRSQDFELESLRSLNHHNTPLSLLTETGLAGLGAFLALLAVWARYAWTLAADANLPPWVRSHGVLMLALLVSYLASALFHDLTLVPQQEWLLAVFAGLTVGLVQQHRCGLSVPSPATYHCSEPALNSPSLVGRG